MNCRRNTKIRLATALIVMLVLLLLNGLFGTYWPTLLVKAGPTLPPLDPPATREPDRDDDNGIPLVAYIELQVQSPSPGLWSVVQWQDTAGQWHDVEGWRGALNPEGYQRWVVLAKDFGTGPFRWAVTQGINGPVLATSTPFNLPSTANEIMIIQISLQPSS